MSGKAVIAILAVFCIGFLIYGLWFFGNRSPIDERFNLKRVTITADYVPALLPNRIGDFQRRSSAPITRAANYQLEGSASYSDTDGKLIWLDVRSLEGQPGVSLDTLTDSSFKLHKDAPFPYGYSTGTNGYTFVWINGNWEIRAYTTEADADTLLQFVNGYPF